MQARGTVPGRSTTRGASRPDVPVAKAPSKEEEMALTIEDMTSKERLHKLVDELSEVEIEPVLDFIASRRVEDTPDDAAKPGDVIDEWGNLDAMLDEESADTMRMLDEEEMARTGETIGDAFARAERERENPR